MSKRLQNTIIVIVAIFVLGLGVAVTLIFSSHNVASTPVNESANSAQYSPQNVNGLVLPLVQLEGNWSAKDGELHFQAKVEGASIKIEMLTDDGVSATYWHGTFKSTESPNTTVVSTKTEATDEIVLSQSATKDFTVGTDGITFKYSALGFSKQVTLKR